MSTNHRPRADARKGRCLALIAASALLVVAATSLTGLSPTKHHAMAAPAAVVGSAAAPRSTLWEPNGSSSHPELATSPLDEPLALPARAQPAYVPRVVLVGLRGEVSAARLDSLRRSVGASRLQRLGPTVRQVGPHPTPPPPLKLTVPDETVRAAVLRLRRDPAIAYAEPDYLMHASSTTSPGDTSFSKEWGSLNTGQSVPSQSMPDETLGDSAAGAPGADDGAARAWGVTTGSPSIVIGEADTGIDYAHPDLAGNVWSNPGDVGGCPAGTHGYNVVSGSCDPMDDDSSYGGHGTHVAGIMGAVGDNGSGVAGMNWHTTLLPVKWLDSDAWGSTSGLVTALQWMVAAKQSGVNVRVVNDSATFWSDRGQPSQAVYNAIKALGDNNILFVTAAGNTSDNDDDPSVRRYPCGYDVDSSVGAGLTNEICVTASDDHDQIPSWANYGADTVDLAAPGQSIYSTLRGGGYGYLTGTSMAAPQVSGAAALVLADDPDLSATELKAKLLASVDQLPSMSGKVLTGGRLDVCNAIPGCAAPPANTTPPAISGNPVAGQTLTATNGAWTDNPTSYGYQWQRDGTAISGQTNATHTVTSADQGHHLTIAVTATNSAGANTATSNPTNIPAPPANTTPPAAAPPPISTAPPSAASSSSPSGTVNSPPRSTSPGRPTTSRTARPLRVAVSRSGVLSLHTLLRHGLVIKARCSAGCRLSLSLALDVRAARRYRVISAKRYRELRRQHRHTVTIRYVSRRLTRGRTTSVRLRLTPSVARRLRRADHLTLHLRGRARPGTGRAQGFTRAFSVRR